MPKLKQPDPLQKMALRALFEFVLRYCDHLSVHGSLEELRRGVSLIKKRVCNYVPWPLLADFCTRFLDEFYSEERPQAHHKAALEMVMDIVIVGLRCKGPIMASLDLKDAHRLQRLKELDLSCFWAEESLSLDNFRLNDLTTFIFAKKCRDLDLKVIGKNCSKLQVLKIRDSKVTDEGLAALSKCPELRVVDISGCPVTQNGVNALLSMHKKLEELVLVDGYSRYCDVFPHMDSTVCPSIRRFVFENERDQLVPSQLRVIAAKFPSLTYLKIICIIEDDLSVLKSLKNLTGLEVIFHPDAFYDQIEETWASLKVLLTFIGENITTLKLTCCDHGFFWNQRELDFFYKHCPNVEHLSFDQGGGLVAIPPFQKLRELYPRIPIEFEQIEILDDPVLEFDKLPSLETLSIIDYGMSLEKVEAIILDDVKFPNLSVIETNCMKPEDLAHIEHVVKSNNLDFKIKNDPKSNWYIEYRFGGSGDSDDDMNDAE